MSSDAAVTTTTKTSTTSKEEKKKASVRTRLREFVDDYISYYISFPNNFEEAPDQPSLENKTRIFDEKVVNNFDRLDALGMFMVRFDSRLFVRFFVRFYIIMF